ncbi:hypothetical protein E2C01_043204 [Portunus trituberculatus]|uniref:Uncharacterized protein n=1 Tax=Portunus trituberculatus TaxID=210409 RepID=A0A5B7FVP2_PORTR|nr:hypothetical protein [Portunus trituberculatus]
MSRLGLGLKWIGKGGKEEEEEECVEGKGASLNTHAPEASTRLWLPSKQHFHPRLPSPAAKRKKA